MNVLTHFLIKYMLHCIVTGIKFVKCAQRIGCHSTKSCHFIYMTISQEKNCCYSPMVHYLILLAICSACNLIFFESVCFREDLFIARVPDWSHLYRLPRALSLTVCSSQWLLIYTQTDRWDIATTDLHRVTLIPIEMVFFS